MGERLFQVRLIASPCSAFRVGVVMKGSIETVWVDNWSFVGFCAVDVPSLSKNGLEWVLDGGFCASKKSYYWRSEPCVVLIGVVMS